MAERSNNICMRDEYVKNGEFSTTDLKKIPMTPTV